MAKSKLRKNRRRGPARSVQNLATRRGGDRLARMIVRQGIEGSRHRLTFDVEEGAVSTMIDHDVIEDPTVMDFIITTLASLTTAALTLETFDGVNRHLRVWLSDAGVFVPADAEEARDAYLQDRGHIEDDLLFQTAMKLTLN